MSQILLKNYPLLPMTPNQRERAHWAKLKREKDDFTLMTPMCPIEGQQEKGGPRRLVEVVFRKPRSKRSVDPDALAFRCKSICDALQRRGWIADDDDLHIELVVREEPFDGHAKSHTIVAVSEMAEVEKAA